ncbi:MAG: CpsD/CapB family tyrosine-protein kinase [Clostridia bacterium]|nr:CpsD/CapB family tyrosine-protein kinase [Clostridia bacterium]
MSLFQKKHKQKHKSSSFAPAENQKTLHKNLEFTATEQYKLLRANLEFTIPEGEKCPVIGVTSSMRGEGKSTTAVNLSYVLAEKGNKVLLIDGDLRIPSVAKKMGIKGSPGLTDLLMGKGASIADFRTELLEEWYILPSGDIPPNPSELLGSSRMEAVLNDLRKMFDYIVIDLPPVNIVSDALSVSHLITGMIVVIREGYTEKKELEACFRHLKLSNVNVLGCVMNEAKSGNGAYGKYRKKYRYYKYYRYYQSNYEMPKDEQQK